MLDFRIYTFLEVCETLNFTKAAEQLHITQPAVSQHIRSLEEYYHTKLFGYEKKSLTLTAAGRLLMVQATAMKNDEQLLAEQMMALPGQHTPLYFGATMTIAGFALAPQLARFLKAHPDTEMRMILGNTQDLMSKLRTGEIHFALLEGFFDAELFDAIPYRTEPFIAICNPRHRFAAPPHVIQDLLDEHILIHEPGSGAHEILKKSLETHNVEFKDFARVTEIGSMHTLVDLVKEDVGIAFLYRVAAEQQLESGELVEIPLGDCQLSHDFSFVWNRGSTYAPLYRQICGELQISPPLAPAVSR